MNAAPLATTLLFVLSLSACMSSIPPAPAGGHGERQVTVPAGNDKPKPGLPGGCEPCSPPGGNDPVKVYER